jgi:simple sugar transport system ATP-binding protein
VKVAEGSTSDFDEAAVIRHMTGLDIEIEPFRKEKPGPDVMPRLDVQGLTLPGDYENINLQLYPGEIVGLSGLLGSGRTELALSLFGMLTPASGSVKVDGKAIALDSVQDAIAEGIAYVPEDRLSEGLFMTQSIKRNIIATSLDNLAKGGIIDIPRVDRVADETIASMQIATPSAEKMVGELSGGNAQRVVLGRWLLTDVGSKAEIHRKIRELVEHHGLAVLMISDDVLEVAQNCSRVILMHRGRFVDELEGDAISEDVISEQLKSFT